MIYSGKGLVESPPIEADSGVGFFFNHKFIVPSNILKEAKYKAEKISPDWLKANL